MERSLEFWKDPLGFECSVSSGCLSGGRRLLVTRVIEDSEAYAAGVQKNWQIIRVNGEHFKHPEAGKVLLRVALTQLRAHAESQTTAGEASTSQAPPTASGSYLGAPSLW